MNCSVNISKLLSGIDRCLVICLFCFGTFYRYCPLEDYGCLWSRTFCIKKQYNLHYIRAITFGLLCITYNLTYIYEYFQNADDSTEGIDIVLNILLDNASSVTCLDMQPRIYTETFIFVTLHQMPLFSNTRS